jgi:hypothetical protein
MFFKSSVKNNFLYTFKFKENLVQLHTYVQVVCVILIHKPLIQNKFLETKLFH